MKKYTRHEIASTIAIVFHAIGLAGILFYDKTLFASFTAYHILLMCALLLYSLKKLTFPFIVFLVACFFIGYFVEYIGISTGWLFGNYTYGNSLGIKVKEVPLIIGLNWFVIVYCCGITAHTIYRRLIGSLGMENAVLKKGLHHFSLAFDTALLAVFFDFIMEPAAIKLGYWEWQSGIIPTFNYACWFLISFILSALFQGFKLDRHNKFAVHLLLIQFMFFLILRTFL